MAFAFTMRLPEELLAEVERLRGDVPRSEWVRRALEMRVEVERGVRSERPARVASAGERDGIELEAFRAAGRAHPTCGCAVCKPA